MDPDYMGKLAVERLAGLGTAHGAALALELQRGMGRRPGHEEAHAVEVEVAENVTFQAMLWQYTNWLEGYVRSGRTPTHSYGYEWSRGRWLHAPGEFAVNGECGASAKHVVIGHGGRVLNPNPWKPFKGFGHNNLFLLDDFQVIGGWVPIYSNPEFDAYREMTR